MVFTLPLPTTGKHIYVLFYHVFFFHCSCSGLSLDLTKLKTFLSCAWCLIFFLITYCVLERKIFVVCIVSTIVHANSSSRNTSHLCYFLLMCCVVGKMKHKIVWMLGKGSSPEGNGCGTGSLGLWSRPQAFKQCCRHRVWFLDGLVWNQEVDLMVLGGFSSWGCSVILWNKFLGVFMYEQVAVLELPQRWATALCVQTSSAPESSITPVDKNLCSALWKAGEKWADLYEELRAGQCL